MQNNIRRGDIKTEGVQIHKNMHIGWHKMSEKMHKTTRETQNDPKEMHNGKEREQTQTQNNWKETQNG